MPKKIGMLTGLQVDGQRLDKISKLETDEAVAFRMVDELHERLREMHLLLVGILLASGGQVTIRRRDAIDAGMRGAEFVFTEHPEGGGTTVSLRQAS